MSNLYTKVMMENYTPRYSDRER